MTKTFTAVTQDNWNEEAFHRMFEASKHDVRGNYSAGAMEDSELEAHLKKQLHPATCREAGQCQAAHWIMEGDTFVGINGYTTDFGIYTILLSLYAPDSRGDRSWVLDIMHPERGAKSRYVNTADQAASVGCHCFGAIVMKGGRRWQENYTGPGWPAWVMRVEDYPPAIPGAALRALVVFHTPRPTLPLTKPPPPPPTEPPLPPQERS